jgi:hypothetical protein
VVVSAGGVLEHLRELDLLGVVDDGRRQRVGVGLVPVGGVLGQPVLVGSVAEKCREREVVGEVFRVGLGVATHRTGVSHTRPEGVRPETRDGQSRSTTITWASSPLS